MNKKLTSLGISCLLVIGGLLGLLNFGSRNAQGITVGGHITTDTVWEIFDSPVSVVDDVVVDEGVTLIITPGVVVKFDGYHSIYVDGNLSAVGLEDSSRIFITSNSGSPQPGAWHRIQINSTGRADIENCDIIYASYAIVLWGSSGNSIKNNNIHDIHNYAIWTDGSEDNNITGNRLWDVGVLGRGLQLDYSKRNSIIDNTISSCDGKGIELRSSSNNTIVNNHLSSTSSGISLWDFSDNNIILNNTISAYNYGIDISHSLYTNASGNTISTSASSGIQITEYSDNTVLMSNNITSSGWDGIYVQESSHLKIIGNHISDSRKRYGIGLRDSSYNIIQGNTMINDGIMFLYSSFEHWTTHEIDESNTANGKPVYYWKNLTEGQIPPNAGQVILANCTNIVVKNQEFEKVPSGIQLGYSSDNIIKNNEISNSTYGFYMWYSDSNFIANNTANISYSGISPLYCFENIFIQNNISFYSLNGAPGLEWGIYIGASDNNIFIGNMVSKNYYGIYLYDSRNNIFHHNNIKNNTIQAYLNSDSRFNNTWDDGNGEGNYWSDYTGVDDGSNGRIAGDGVGDTEIPHPEIDQGEGYFQLDNYPLLDFVRGGLYLHEGWNLISIPTVQLDTNLETVLSPISGAYQAVRWYDSAATADPWKHNHTQKPPYLNDLDELNHTMGFWIYINKTGGVLFRYYGLEPSSGQSIQLHPGWNLVGYPSLTSYNRTDGLNNTEFGTHINVIYWYDASTRTWHNMGNKDRFERGRGYWVHAREEIVWQVPL